jgi:hypothetical protein
MSIFSRNTLIIERQKDNLSISEIEAAIFNSIIVESYPLDQRDESCLLVGFTNFGKPVHVVCGKHEEQLIIITVYIPGPPNFKNPYERG